MIVRRRFFGEARIRIWLILQPVSGSVFRRIKVAISLRPRNASQERRFGPQADATAR
jgi:hypothetical protein